MPLIEHKSLDGLSQQVVDADRRRALYKCYSTGSLTSNNAYAQLKQVQCGGLVPLLAHGHFNGKDFELIAHDVAAKPLDEWAQRNLGEPAALWFIRQCADVLTSLHGVELAPPVEGPAPGRGVLRPAGSEAEGEESLTSRHVGLRSVRRRDVAGPAGILLDGTVRRDCRGGKLG